MSSHRHIQYSQAVGDDGQRRYYNSCRAANLNIQKTTKANDMNHVDFIVDGKTVDVKGIKKSHKKAQILVELKNVLGKDGWCSANGPEFVSFDFGLFFIHVKNADLLNLVKKKCNMKTFVPKYEDALYKAYSRKGRDDLMTLVSLTDVIQECEHWFLPFEDFHEPYRTHSCS